MLSTLIALKESSRSEKRGLRGKWEKRGIVKLPRSMQVGKVGASTENLAPQILSMQQGRLNSVSPGDTHRRNLDKYPRTVTPSHCAKLLRSLSIAWWEAEQANDCLQIHPSKDDAAIAIITTMPTCFLFSAHRVYQVERTHLNNVPGQQGLTFVVAVPSVLSFHLPA